jgi:hypothetical protein
MQPEPATIDLAMIIIRGATLIIAGFGGLLSIYLGWKLYRNGLASAVSAEASKTDSWAFKMKAMGPGIFFALFGMALLIYLVRQEMTIEDSRVVAVPAVEARRGGEDPLPACQPAPASPGVFAGEATVGTPALPPARSGPERRQGSARETAAASGEGICLLQERSWRRYSDGSELSRQRIRTALNSAERLLAKLDRSTLTLDERAELESTRDTFDRMTGAMQ